VSYDAIAKRYQEALRPEDVEWLHARGLTDRTIAKARLGYVIDGRYRNSISIPYLNPYTHEVRTIRYRYLNPVYNKYDGHKGVGTHLYNVENTLAERIWICEGEFDSLVLTQEGFPAVAIPGANSFKAPWKYLFSNADQVSLVFDSDEAGDRGAQRIASMIGDVVDDLRIIRLPEGTDVTDLYLRSKDELRELVS
jgi:DNA primase